MPSDARRNIMPSAPTPRKSFVSSALDTAPTSQPPADTQASPHSTTAQGTPATGTTSTALLRVYSPASGDHLYTASVAERDTAVAQFGYVDEGVAFHVFATAGTGTTPLLRVFKPATVDHFYTTSVADRDNAVATHGYRDEGVACHVYPN